MYLSASSILEVVYLIKKSDYVVIKSKIQNKNRTFIDVTILIMGWGWNIHNDDLSYFF